MCIALILLLSFSSQVFKEPDLQDSIDFSTSQILFNAGLPLYLKIQNRSPTVIIAFKNMPVILEQANYGKRQNNASKTFAINKNNASKTFAIS